MKIYHQFRLDLFPNRDTALYVKWLERKTEALGDEIAGLQVEVNRLRVAAGEVEPPEAV